jgi:hypothetical protein
VPCQINRSAEDWRRNATFLAGSGSRTGSLTRFPRGFAAALGHCRLVEESPLFPRDPVCVQPSQDCFGSQLVSSRCNACTHAAPMTGTDRGVSGETTRASVAGGAVQTGGATSRGKVRVVAVRKKGQEDERGARGLL